ncbi:MAG: CehA/McbA family metallohydrolase [Planctomycetaceae bacterium]|nr:CehA/McbA family metallohydrolase [Planctomycetaceae bacterium]
MKRLIRFASGVVLLAFVVASSASTAAVAADGQTRPAASPEQLSGWLENMAWHHRYSMDEMCQVTGLDADTLSATLQELQITEANRPKRPADRVFVLPYPGGRHPRIGFLDGAVEPQRETKLSAFCPWDDHSYAVLDVPEAIWSNLGLTYLAHTHVDTLWTKQGIDLPHQEWEILEDGSFVMERRLPNGIVFGTKVIPRKDHLQMKMWLTNGTDQPLTDLRVQNCVMLKAADGFNAQSNDNKLFQNGYAVVRSEDGGRFMITAWDPIHRAWGNAPCPCLHSDPRFEDCPPGETRFLRGWFSFYQGQDIDAELQRIESTGWRKHPLHHLTGNVTGTVRDARSGTPLPCRLYVRNSETHEWHFARSTAVAGSAVEYRKQIGNTPSVEKHVTLSADPFQLDLPPGRYHIRAERGKEYLPAETEITVREGGRRIQVPLRLTRFVNMTELGWYSGDTHVHRAMTDLPNLVLAEDLNVALPLNYWVRDSTEIPSASAVDVPAELLSVDATHVIWPINTEYEIFTVNRKRHTQGAVFVLNHQRPLNIPAPPALPVAEEARRQNALLDLDKHSWAWSMMIVPRMQVDLFELSNNHNWRTQFGFPQWTLENAPDWPEVERNESGLTERGWTEFGMQTYYALLNCGFRMRVSGGTGSGVHPVPLGHGRVYVHTGDDFSYDGWIRGLNAGHSFVTTGPLADIRFDGQLPGTTWADPRPRSINITGVIRSPAPLKSIQYILNGAVVKDLETPPTRITHGAQVYDLDEQIDLPTGSCWLAVRCFEDRPDGKISFLHTNPVFVDVKDAPLKPRVRDASFFVKRMDEEIARNTGVLSDEALAEYREVRDIYARLLEQAGGE